MDYEAVMKLALERGFYFPSWSQLPPMGKRFFGPSDTVHPAEGEKKMTVALLSGCVMPLMQGTFLFNYYREAVKLQSPGSRRSRASVGSRHPKSLYAAGVLATCARP